jgi:hypothetical protein
MASALSESSVSNSDAYYRQGARKHFWALTLGSIGVVYGDIGTSPLYAMREAVLASGGTGTSGSEIILGILSLIIWALILVVTVKYVLILLRADNEGEGGTLSLMALAQSALGRGSNGNTGAVGFDHHRIGVSGRPVPWRRRQDLYREFIEGAMFLNDGPPIYGGRSLIREVRFARKSGHGGI